MAEKTPENFLVSSFSPNGSGRFFADVTTEDGSKYIYVPREFVYKGVRIGDQQYFDEAFLNKDYLNVLKPVAVGDDLLYDSLKKVGYEEPNVGFLIKEDDFKKYDKKPENVTAYNAVGKFAGPVQGIGEKDGKLVYSFAGAGGSNYGYLDSKGTPTEVTITVTPGKSRFGKLGQIASDIAGSFASIPLLPEIAAAVIPGAGPALYGSLKSLQTAGKGGDLGDVVKSGVLSAGAMGVAQGLLATPTGTPQPGVDYSLTGGGVDVGGLGFKADPGMLAPELGASIGAGGVVAPGVGLVVDPGMLAPALGTNLGVVVPPTDYSLLGGADLTGVGETGLIPGSIVGLQAPTLPAVSSMGGAQGLSVPVEGGTVTQGGFTPTEAVPVLGDPASFINDPNVLGQPVISAEPASIISLSDAFRAARTINSLMGAGGEQPGAPQRQELGQMQPTGVDTLMLPQLTAGVPNIAGLLNPMPYRGPYFDVYTGLPSLLG